jgi:outer membrane protein OmpA-like peptidoglycan-associated protein
MLRDDVNRLVKALQVVPLLTIAGAGCAAEDTSRASPRSREGVARTQRLDTPGIDAVVAQLRRGRVVVAAFEFLNESDTLSASAADAFPRIAAALARMPASFLVEAHVTPTGNLVADQWLADRRAAVVRARLIEAGVPAERLYAMGFSRARRARDRPERPRIELSRMP